MGRARWAWEWAGAERPQGLGRPQRLRAESQLRHLFSSAFQRISQALLRVGGWGGAGVDSPQVQEWTAPQRKDLGCLVCLVALLWSDWNFSISEVCGWGASGIIKWGFRLEQLQISSLIGLPDVAE